MNSSPRSISVVIPAYNEARRLPGTIERIAGFAARQGNIHEVIIVDDGSRDETAAVVNATSSDVVPFRLVGYRSNAGKGYAIRRGIMEATGEAVLISDADLSTPIEELSKLLNAFESSDLVIGSRALEQSEVRVRQAWYRQRMGKVFNALMGTITGLPFADTQCGFKLLRRETAKRVFEQATVDRFAWDVEMLMIACQMGYRIREVPVVWINSSDSRVRIVRDSLRMLFDTLRMRARLGRARCAAPEDGHGDETQRRED
ncbi:MAG TPA: dolichyl-phosphate beta-glucosyltransferase [Thermoanaerobaculia bacterium]|nr:dolichyl-phosphate beta-glucosyltransferase [Thermoanaerobaculia bacterium]